MIFLLSFIGGRKKTSRRISISLDVGIAIWPTDGKERKQMNSKHSEGLGIGSLVAFIILCSAWFLHVSGLLGGLLRGF